MYVDTRAQGETGSAKVRSQKTSSAKYEREKLGVQEREIEGPKKSAKGFRPGARKCKRIDPKKPPAQHYPSERSSDPSQSAESSRLTPWKFPGVGRSPRKYT
jgi:hypothetical protein